MKIMISTSRNPKNYRAVLEACGVTVVGGYLPEPDPDCAGLVLCGGADIDPAIYGAENRGSVEIDADRDAAELRLLDFYRDRPILGICRGVQILNAFFGGTLIQDLPTRDSHTSPDGDLFHRVTALPGSRMERVYGAAFDVNSSHHQAVDLPAPGFRVTLRADDGAAEAIEHTSLPVFGVQWHPERTTLAFRGDRAVDGMGVWREFLRLCQNF